jgi:hypothetical protein
MLVHGSPGERFQQRGLPLARLACDKDNGAMTCQRLFKEAA